MSLDYEKMLDEAYSKLPREVSKHERFEIPKMQCTTFGARTIFHNFKEVCDIMNRNPVHVLRYLSKEMATAGTIDGNRAIFQGKFELETCNQILKRYVNEFVVCPVCKRPDTKIVKEKRLFFLVCEACGARSPVKPV
ncbi:translation initiation factor IF-2 subunit beta [Candidatus Bathyarchaeota archaeon]|nr:translation initiation factor IF-2 subunit beta [Candidatus Bathyarchaeota archaeon]